MTPPQVERFVRRLVAGEVSGVEMVNLRVNDLLKISDYLLQHPELLETHAVGGSRVGDEALRTSYSEQEILDELA